MTKEILIEAEQSKDEVISALEEALKIIKEKCSREYDRYSVKIILPIDGEL